MRRDGRSEIKTTDGRGQTTEDGRRKSEDSLSVVRGPCPWSVANKAWIRGHSDQREMREKRERQLRLQSGCPFSLFSPV